MRFDKTKIKLIAFDLDGTLTQHKEKLCSEHRAILEALSKKYKLVMVGAGKARRIFEQMERFPIDIIGNYGLQRAVYNGETGDIDILCDLTFPVDKEKIEHRVNFFREKYGFTVYRGENVEYHDSGCITFPILGTKAIQSDKLAFDPDRSKRRAIYDEVCEAFPEYNVFVGGSSSFDMSPMPHNKYHALNEYCADHGIAHSEVVFVGDDYGRGGNDESVYKSDFGYLEIDDYRDFPTVIKELL